MTKLRPRAALPIPRQSLQRLFQLNDEYQIEAIYYDVYREVLFLIISNDQFPETPEGQLLPELVMQVHERHDEDGRVWVNLEVVGVKSHA